MFELKVVTDFAAAHRLSMVTDKCENLHGHNWKVEACVAGEELNAAGVLIDFGEIKSRVREIVAELDHCYLNELKFFDGNPSSERVAVHIAKRLTDMLSGTGLRVSRIVVWESNDACATYIPEQQETRA